MKVCLYGKHSNRTPLSYPSYQALFSKYFDYVKAPEHADFVVSGFNLDFRNDIAYIENIKKKNPNIKFVIFSEEPLWDTIWSKGFECLNANLSAKVNDNVANLNYFALNHVTTNIFDFEKIPYFLTTEDKFFIRYSYFFNRNKKITKENWKKIWDKASISHAFFAAKRVGDQYDYVSKNKEILGLSRYRSLLAENLKGHKVLREGSSWSTDDKRQDLPDWHLDKLVELDKNAYVVSALENTHVSNYISEKIFDAFALGAVPIYYAASTHKVNNIVNPLSFINLFGLNVDSALNKVQGFNLNVDHFLEAYIETQNTLAQCFDNPQNYVEERKRIVSETVKYFSSL